MTAHDSSENQRSSEERTASNGPQWDSVLRNTALVVVLLVMLWVVFNVELPSAEELQSQIERLGWAGWLAFIALYALVALTPIPVTIMAMTGGLLFGVALGSVFSVIGVLIGCWGAYWLARVLGSEAVRKLLGSYGKRVEGHLADAGFQAVCAMRLAPGIPYWPVNYGSGAFGVGQRVFLVASIASVIPGQVSLVAIGAFIADPSWPTAAVVIIAWVFVLALTFWAMRSWRAHTRKDPT